MSTPPDNKADVLRLLDQARDADRRLQRFGAASHQYRLNPPLTTDVVDAFEARHKVALPADYKHFITRIGNGGAGPAYGLFRFGEHDHGDGVCSWDQGYMVGDPGAAFGFEDSWNLPASFWENRPDPGTEVSEEEEDRLMEAWGSQLDEHYWNPAIMNGAIPICHQGCALRQWLVINGKQRGFVWDDLRVDEDGLVPLRDEHGKQVTFTDWYMDWLRGIAG